MGAKSPAKLKLRRPTYKCDICHRKLLSAQALKTHKYCIHKISSSNSEQRAKTVIKTKKPQIEKPKPKSMPSKDAEGEVKELMTQNVSDVRKIEFECPVCNVMFSAYYPAYRHIQKTHCINSRGQKVDSTSSDLIKPLRVEMCIKCNKRIRANDAHCCSETLVNQSGMGLKYLCTGCKQQFASMQLFDMHVSGLHSEGVESMFFPSMNDFLSWKQQMQTKTSVDYLILGKCNSKQTYRCTYLPPCETTAHNNISHICPSSIVVQEFTKGIQVHFYRKHYGHDCPEYICPEKYKKFLITSLMTEKNPYDVVYDEKDLYCQFKVLLESIIVEAAKVKVDDLKLMLEKALEMTSILNNYDEDDDTYTYSNKQSLCEEQIAKALDNLKCFQMKRKASENTNVVDPKKRKELTPKIVNAYSIASKTPETKKVEQKKEIKVDEKKEVKIDQKKEVVNKANEIKKDEVPSPRILRNTPVQSSPSFNDSYKDFVDKNFMSKPLTTENGKPSKSSTLGKPPVRRASPVSKPTRGLRVRPLSKLVEPSEIEEELAKDFIEVSVPIQIKDNKDKEKNIKQPAIEKDIKQPVKEKVIKQTTVVDKPTISPEITIKKVPPKESKEAKDSTEDDAKQHSKELKGPAIRKENTPRTKPRKQVMKTKIGQFKPSLSPKSTSPNKPELNRSFGRIKPDIQYEVKEQENDCNILILKI